MKLIIVVSLALVAVAVAAPAAEQVAETIKQTFDVSPDGSFQSAHETTNGIKEGREGVLKQGVDAENKPVTYLILRGFYTQIDAEGKEQTVNYVADESGYNAESALIPKNQ